MHIYYHLGIMERRSNKVLLWPVDDRSQETLVPLIKRYVEPGTRIYSDGWEAYRNLNAEGFEHFSVIHKYNYMVEYQNEETGEIVKVGQFSIYFYMYHLYSSFSKSNIFGIIILLFSGPHQSDGGILEACKAALQVDKWDQCCKFYVSD